MSGPRRSGFAAEMLEKYRHAGGHLREALLDALDHDDEWWKHIEIDFNRERHNRWWSRLSDQHRAKWLLGQLWPILLVVVVALILVGTLTPAVERRWCRATRRPTASRACCPAAK